MVRAYWYRCLVTHFTPFWNLSLVEGNLFGVDVIGDVAANMLDQFLARHLFQHREVEWIIGRDDQRAVDAAALELDGVAGLAFDHGAFHVELLLDILGPFPGDADRRVGLLGPWRG